MYSNTNTCDTLIMRSVNNVIISVSLQYLHNDFRALGSGDKLLLGEFVVMVLVETAEDLIGCVLGLRAAEVAAHPVDGLQRHSARISRRSIVINCC